MFCRGTGLSALFRATSIFDPESLGGWARDTVREVDIVTGCFFLIRKELWDSLSGFDTSFFMYGEDADLCLRAKKADYTCMICPYATIIHYGTASERLPDVKMVRLFRAKAQLCRRHWHPLAASFGIWTLDLWALTRLIASFFVGIVRKDAAKQSRMWATIWRRRSEWHSVE